MINTFKTLFNSFLEICLFRKGPQDLPASNFFLGIVIGISAVVALVINLINLPLQSAFLAVLVNLAIVIIITQLILRLYNKPMRLTQTLTAQMGTSIVIAIFAIPVFVMLQYAQNNDVNTNAGVIFWLILFIWEIAVNAHILRHALSSSLVQGFLFAILYPVIYYQVAGYLVPTASQ